MDAKRTEALQEKPSFANNFRFPPKFLIYTVIILALVITGDFLSQRYVGERFRAQQFTRTQVELGVLRANLESAITANLQIIDAVAAYVSVNPELTQDEFDQYAQAILRQPNKLANIAAAPDFRVSYVFPLEGHEALVGMDYRNLPEQWPDAQRAKETGRIAIAGPLKLVQGGTGIVGRAPVYVTREGQREFWGLVSSMIDFDALMDEILSLASDLGLVIALTSGPTASGDTPAVIWDTTGLTDNNEAVSMTIHLPNTQWRLLGAPVAGGQRPLLEAPVIHGTWGGIAILLLLFGYIKLTADAELRASERRFRDLTLSSSDWIWEIDGNGVYTYASGRVSEILGYEPEELIGQKPFSIMDEEEAERVRTMFARMAADRRSIRELENWVTSKSGERVCLLTTAVPILDETGALVGYRGVDKDITLRKTLQNQLEERQWELERYIDMVDTHVIISQTDLEGYITYASEAFCKISGFTKEELFRENHNKIRHPDMPDSLFADLWSTITSGRLWTGEIKNLKKDGGYYWVDADISSLVDKDGRVYGYMAIRHDITDKKRVEEMSITDRLTGLFNRIKLDQMLEEQQKRMTRYGETYALILLDIDHFKLVNDTYGHLTGDQVLSKVAGLIGAHIRETDVAGRWGGEEFLIVCPHTDTDGAAATAEHLRAVIEGGQFPEVPAVTASFGVAVARKDEGLTSLMKRADDALYEAKQNGRNRVVTAPLKV